MSNRDGPPDAAAEAAAAAAANKYEEPADGDDEVDDDDGDTTNYQDPPNIYYAASAAAAAAATAAGTDTSNKWRKTGFGEENFRTGKFTKEESDLVKQSVQEYCTWKHISPSRLCSECDHKSELKGAWTEIAKRLPNRSVQSVYRHGLRLLHPFKRGAWSPEECEQLVAEVKEHGKKWSTISSKVNRSADACRDKYREMDDMYVRGRWNDAETEKLKTLLREHLNADKRMDMRELGKMVEAEGIKIQWSAISKRMKNRSRLSCFKKWQKMTGLSFPSITQPEESDLTVNPTDKYDPHVAPAVGLVVVGDHSMGTTATAEEDMDLILLTGLAACNATRASDIAWESLRVPNAHERWNELMEEYQSTATDDAVLAMPLSEIAQAMLDQKTSAQRAAETVEAVDLPVV